MSSLLFLKTSLFIKSKTDLSYMKTKIPLFYSGSKVGELPLDTRHVESPLLGVETHFADAVLQETVDKLAIIAARLPRAKPKFDFRNLKERFMNAKKSTLDVFDRDFNEPVCKMGVRRYYLKLAKELKELDKILSLIVYELSVGNREGFKFYLENMREKHHDEELLITKYRKTRTLLSRVKHLHIVDQIMTNERMIKKKKILQILEMALSREKFNHAVRLSYAKEYEQARVESNKIALTAQEKKVERKFAEMKKALEDEKNVHESIVKFLDKSIEILLEKIQYWTEALSADVEYREMMIFSLRTERTDVAAEMMVKLKEYTIREKEMDSYLAERDVRMKLEERRELLSNMAVRIQSWWRGTMVRWELGPYRIQKDKKKKKKK